MAKHPTVNRESLGSNPRGPVMPMKPVEVTSLVTRAAMQERVELVRRALVATKRYRERDKLRELVELLGLEWPKKRRIGPQIRRKVSKSIFSEQL